MSGLSMRFMAVLVLAAITSGAAMAASDTPKEKGVAGNVEGKTEAQTPAAEAQAPKASTPAKAEDASDKDASDKAKKGSKVVTEFPASLKGFKGRLLGKIAEVNKTGIVLADIRRVEVEAPSPFGNMTMTVAVAKDAPGAWLQRKTVQLLYEDNAYKKKYKPGQVIFGVVEWSDKDKALVIKGAQWQGVR